MEYCVNRIRERIDKEIKILTTRVEYHEHDSKIIRETIAELDHMILLRDLSNEEILDDNWVSENIDIEYK